MDFRLNRYKHCGVVKWEEEEEYIDEWCKECSWKAEEEEWAAGGERDGGGDGVGSGSESGSGSGSGSTETGRATGR
jgi:hypothetical protein